MTAQTANKSTKSLSKGRAKTKQPPQTAKRRPGQPEKYRVEFIEQARKLCMLGARDQDIADFFGIPTSTLYNWKNAHPEFMEALKAAKQTIDEQVERRLFERAMGYEHPAIKIAINADGKITEAPFIERFAPDTTAAIFWLKNRQPARWRDIKAQEISGPGGAPIPITPIDWASVPIEMRRAIAALPKSNT